MKIRSGIDIGINGAIVIFEDDVIKTKTVTPCIGNQIDLPELRKIFERYKEKNIHIVVEDVHALFEASAKSTFNFGVSNICLDWSCNRMTNESQEDYIQRSYTIARKSIKVAAETAKQLEKKYYIVIVT